MAIQHEFLDYIFIDYYYQVFWISWHFWTAFHYLEELSTFWALSNPVASWVLPSSTF